MIVLFSKRVALTALSAAVLVTGCQAEQPAAPAAQAETPLSTPSAVLAETFAGCTWGKVSGAVASIDAYACPADKGDFAMIADDALPGFVIEGRDGDGAAQRRVALRFFDKAADAAVTSIAAQLEAVSPGVDGAGCQLVPAGAETEQALELTAGTAFVWEPTGAVKEAWDAWNSPPDTPAAGAPPAPPCGVLGPQVTGLMTFQELAGNPGKVVMVDWGSEVQPFAYATLRANTAQ